MNWIKRGFLSFGAGIQIVCDLYSTLVILYGNGMFDIGIEF
jgi:hypothetical protein